MNEIKKTINLVTELRKQGFEIKDIASLINFSELDTRDVFDKNEPSNDYDYKCGENYFIRTVTHILVGRLVHKTDKELIIDNASWIADTGRYSDAFIKGDFDEIEPYPKNALIHVNRGSFIDACVWGNELPSEQK